MLGQLSLGPTTGSQHASAIIMGGAVSSSAAASTSGWLSLSFQSSSRTRRVSTSAATHSAVMSATAEDSDDDKHVRRCEECDEPLSDALPDTRAVATLFCSECEMNYCETCSEKIHSKGARKRHRLIPLTRTPPTDVLDMVCASGGEETPTTRTELILDAPPPPNRRAEATNDEQHEPSPAVPAVDAAEDLGGAATASVSTLADFVRWYNEGNSSARAATREVIRARVAKASELPAASHAKAMRSMMARRDKLALADASRNQKARSARDAKVAEAQERCRAFSERCSERATAASDSWREQQVARRAVGAQAWCEIQSVTREEEEVEIADGPSLAWAQGISHLSSSLGLLVERG